MKVNSESSLFSNFLYSIYFNFCNTGLSLSLISVATISQLVKTLNQYYDMDAAPNLEFNYGFSSSAKNY